MMNSKNKNMQKQNLKQKEIVFMDFRFMNGKTNASKYEMQG